MSDISLECEALEYRQFIGKTFLRKREHNNYYKIIAT